MTYAEWLNRIVEEQGGSVVKRRVARRIDPMLARRIQGPESHTVKRKS